MQHNRRYFHAHCLYLIEKLCCKMQSRRRRGGTSLFSCVYRLVSALVTQSLLDIGRQGHFAYLIEYGIKILPAAPVIFKGNYAVSVIDNLIDMRDKLSPAEGNAHSLAQASARAHESFPCIEIFLAQEHKFHLCSLSAVFVYLFAVDACGYNLGIVYHKHIALVQIFRYIAEYAMLHSLLFPVEHHKTRFVALFARMLCYQLLRQVIMEISRFQLCRLQFVLNQFCFPLQLILSFRPRASREIPQGRR